MTQSDKKALEEFEERYKNGDFDYDGINEINPREIKSFIHQILKEKGEEMVEEIRKVKDAGEPTEENMNERYAYTNAISIIKRIMEIE